MADYDKDGDVRMETQYITENKPTQQVAATTSQNVNTAVQQTDIRVESTSVSSSTDIRCVSSKDMVACQ